MQSVFGIRGKEKVLGIVIEFEHYAALRRLTYGAYRESFFGACLISAFGTLPFDDFLFFIESTAFHLIVQIGKSILWQFSILARLSKSPAISLKPSSIAVFANSG